jgi:hypothetical protein
MINQVNEAKLNSIFGKEAVNTYRISVNIYLLYLDRLSNQQAVTNINHLKVKTILKKKKRSKMLIEVGCFKKKSKFVILD